MPKNDIEEARNNKKSAIAKKGECFTQNIKGWLEMSYLKQ